MVAQLVKGLKLKKLRVDQVRLRILNELRAEGRAIKKEFEKTTATWDGNWPDNKLLRKKAWLDWIILFKRKDQNAILEAMTDMRGENEPTDEGVDEVKKNSE